jgi:hypothetical protein
MVGCVKDSAIPAYVTVNPFTLETNNGTQGSNSHDITDVWFFLDDELQGVYELPAQFPVIGEGSHTVRMRPGIKVSGLDAWRTIYPFYTFETQTVDLEPNKDYVFDPETEYFPDVNFAWMEAFENPGLSFSATENSDTGFYRITDDAEVFEGSGSGVFYLDTARWWFRGLTNGIYQLPGGGRNVYLEMDYRSSNSMVVGVIGWNSDGTSEARSTIGLFDSPEWNKIYINLSLEIGAMASAVGYSIYIESILDNDNDTAWCYFDNFKLIHE